MSRLTPEELGKAAASLDHWIGYAEYQQTRRAQAEVERDRLRAAADLLADAVLFDSVSGCYTVSRETLEALDAYRDAVEEKAGT